MSHIYNLFNFSRRPSPRVKEAWEAWNNDPDTLLAYLGMKSDGCGLGYVCPYCGSGSGIHGTGMSIYASGKGNFRLKCFACDANKSPRDLIIDLKEIEPDSERFRHADRIMIEVYSDADTEPAARPRISRAILPRYRSKTGNILYCDNTLMDTLEQSVMYRQACREWQQKLADKLGLPFSALNRPDLGKTFVRAYGLPPDGPDPRCGDLAMYNLLDGVPVAVKVRHVSGRDTMTALDPASNRFYTTHLLSSPDKHAFRMTGPSGQVCFGHDTVTEGISTVIIVEGQSDVLAVCAALEEMALMQDFTCIGRDSSNHILQEVDLAVLAGKRIIYVEDHDTHGNHINEKNIALLTERGCRVSCWTAPAEQKDSRAYYIRHGAAALVYELLSAPLTNK